MVVATEEQQYSSAFKTSTTGASMATSFDYGVECAPIGVTAKHALLLANIEKRLIMGLSDAINSLAKTPEEYLFCFMAPPQPGDSATHMHEVLLQAFCFEHDIYIIKVDSAEKLSRLLGSSSLQSCALIQKNWSPDHQTELLSKAEDQLVDYCEEHWDSPIKPTVRLPDK
ncbi:uncharacterized protein LOC129725604 [Wyeomyia smithii]|uniref:uncharacterized protein LOC129725604 n=1 Tax=Wyeomyia smithii TaxID=174621 RepID=UPI0024680332|nr:uncharacterized protein LOC129725604 [Wyeomyia smithii]